MMPGPLNTTDDDIIAVLRNAIIEQCAKVVESGRSMKGFRAEIAADVRALKDKP